MSTTYSANLRLGTPALGDNYPPVLDANRALLDSLAPIGGLAVVPTETPSATVRVQISAGTFLSSAWAMVAYAGAAPVTLTASATNYLYLDDAGSFHQNTTGFPAGANIVRLAVVVAGASSITSVTDARVSLVSGGNVLAYLSLAGGTLNDGANLAVGTTTGTKIATASTQKLGFFGATPVVQPSALTAITDSTTGTPSSTLNDVGTAFTHATLDNNFATIAAKINAIQAALHNLGLMG